MKFLVSFKDPDSLGESIAEAVSATIPDGTPDDEHEALQELREERTRAFCYKFFKYGEYLTVEIDTDAGTCTVVPVK